MRKCIRCQSDMLEGCSLRVEGAGYGVVVTAQDKLFADRLGKPCVAVCPKCGEISLYLENTEKLLKYRAASDEAEEG